MTSFNWWHNKNDTSLLVDCYRVEVLDKNLECCPNEKSKWVRSYVAYTGRIIIDDDWSWLR